MTNTEFTSGDVKTSEQELSAKGRHGAANPDREGALVLAATPIGNAGDASERLREAIEYADIVAAEDTRRFKNLCSRLGIASGAKIIALHDHNEEQRGAWLIDEVGNGKVVLVVSDAGTPTVSDPGYHLVTLAIAAGVRIVPLPGPSAALAALSVSGLPTDRFVFEGFLPRKPSSRHRRLVPLSKDPRTVIIFESPRRTAATLVDLAEHFGDDRPAALCRELTKVYEEVRRGTLRELAEGATSQEVLGEVTIVIGGAPEAKAPADMEDIGRRVLATAEREELRLKDAAALIANQEGLRKNQVMQAALDLAARGWGFDTHEE